MQCSASSKETTYDGGAEVETHGVLITEGFSAAAKNPVGSLYCKLQGAPNTHNRVVFDTRTERKRRALIKMDIRTKTISEAADDQWLCKS
jgi:hypothetical protein